LPAVFLFYQEKGNGRVETKKITIIGAGTMGRGIAQLLSQYLLSVRMIEENVSVLKGAKVKIKEQWNVYKDYDFVNEAKIKDGLSRIFVSDRLEDAEGSWMVIEAIPEVLELKQSLFQQLEAICGQETIFATNTSRLSINKICEKLKSRERFIGTHFFMPATINR
jgi:3-hydroxybutyryl-CoA dehydrogenase